MQIALVVHAFPEHPCGGVEVHAAALARALAEAGHAVGVFAGERTASRTPLSLRAERRDGFDVTWIELPAPTGDVELDFEPPGIEAAFAGWLGELEPDVVHVEHWMKLGPGIVRAARRAGVPVSAVAHDLWTVTARYTALAPDMTPLAPDMTPFAAGGRTVADTAMLARCDLAERHLATIARLGDAHGHVLPAELEADEARALAAILHGDPLEAGIEPDTFARAVRARRRVELARREVVRGTEVLLAPTHWLADELRARCPVGTRIEVDANGIDLRPFGAAPTAKREAGVRFAYCGALLRQKGVHALLRAFDALRGATLSIHGGSTDSAWSSRIARECERVGATFTGPFEHADIAALLRDADVIIVPSVWPENAPLVVREAHAACVPVVASRVGAMHESVRDGVDGILFEPGDARALRAVMERFVAEPGLAATLRKGIRAPRSIEDQAAFLVERWTELARQAPRAGVALPASVRTFAARVERVAALEPDDLLAQVTSGLARLRAGLLPREDPAARDGAWVRALGRSSLVQDLARADAESHWLRSVVAGREGEIAHLVRERRALLEAKSSLERECVWRQATERDAVAHARDEQARAGGLEAALAESRREAGDSAFAVDSARARAAWSDQVSQSHASEAAWLRTVRTALETERDWLRTVVSDLRAQIAEHARSGAERERELDWRRETALEREREHELQLERQRALVDEQQADNAELRQALDIARARGLALEARVEALRAARDVLEAEARWRECEMEDVRRSLARGRFRIVGRGLRTRALAWPARGKGGDA